MSAIETELTTLMDLDRGDMTADQWYRTLATGYGTLTDDQVEGLSESTYSWAESAVEAINGRTNIPPFPDAPTPEPEDEPEVPEAAKKSRNNTIKFREIILQNYRAPRHEIEQLAAEQGIHLSVGSVNGLLYHTRQTVELIYELYGWALPVGPTKQRSSK
jgi:hypothetical protein